MLASGALERWQANFSESSTNSKIRRLEIFLSSEEASEVASERTLPIEILYEDSQKLGFSSKNYEESL